MRYHSECRRDAEFLGTSIVKNDFHTHETIGYTQEAIYMFDSVKFSALSFQVHDSGMFNRKF
jgi:hypothetical protein